MIHRLSSTLHILTSFTIALAITACGVPADQNQGSGADTKPDMTPDMQPDMTPDMQPDMTPDMTPDMQPDMTPDMIDPPKITDIVPSKGCGMPAFAAQGKWEKQPSLKIGNRNRNWHVRFPNNYDPNRAYPLTFEFHGCGSKTNNIPIDKVAGSDAIHVRGEAVDSCWNDLAKGNINNNTESFDLPFIDEMIKEMKEMSCVDENRLFGVGYSSGGWLATILACKRANVFRGLGSVAGADWVHMHNLDPPTCTEGNVARMYISDKRDNGSNRWDNHKSAEARLVERNGCTPGSETPVETASCVEFQGCGDYPIQRCRTSVSGYAHSRQDGYSPQAFWTFFSKL